MGVKKHAAVDNWVTQQHLVANIGGRLVMLSTEQCIDQEHPVVEIVEHERGRLLEDDQTMNVVVRSAPLG